MSDDDDLFASLGGSLMKDLLADLAVDDGEDGWMSLDELERELAHLDQGSRGLASLSTVQETPSTAASMVVANQARGGAHATDTMTATTTTAGINNPAVDAWSLSFQRFSAAALEQDFLQADSARKQQQQEPQQQPPPPGLPGLDLASIKDYNINETAKVAPPPGMTGSARATEGQGEQIISQAAAKLMQQLQQQAAEEEGKEQDQVMTTPSPKEAPLPPPKIPKPSMPPTPQNSMSLGADGTPMPLPGRGTMGFAPTPPPSAAVTPQVMPSMAVPPMAQGMVALPAVVGGQQPVALGSIPVAVPLAAPPSGGRAWQRPVVPVAPRLQPLPPRPVYCNPHPRAPPVPATALASKYMTSRDIGYVVHGILRHLQTAGASSIDDYDVQYWVRRNGKAAEQAVVQRSTTKKTASNENVSTDKEREQKAKEWSSAQKTLGHVAKASVSRPRALLAQPVPEILTSESSKQRAVLWKARIYVDQAYQAFMKVIDLLKTSPPGQVPPVQPYLRKLLKCMGLQKTKDGEQQQQAQQQQADHHQEYVVVDEQAMKLLLKLDKGKILMSRVLEQALLPPKAVQTALPVLLRVLCENPPTRTPPSSSVAVDDPADSRLFGILARIIQTLPQLSTESLLEALEAVEQQSAAALSTTARMQCAHALLQRGGRVAANDKDFQEKWSKMEDTFLQILAAM